MQIICVHRYQIQWAAFQWCPVYITPGVPKVQRGGGGGKKKKTLLIYKNSPIIQIWHALSVFLQKLYPDIPEMQRTLHLRFLKCNGGGGVKIPQSYCTMIKCSLYICFIKKIILHAFFLRCPGYIAPEVPNIEKKITPVLMYKKLLTLQILQAISVASKKHSRGAQGTCLRDQKTDPHHCPAS